MPAGDVFGLDGIFLNKSNPITVSVVDINPASSSAGIAITGGSFSSGTVTLNLSNTAGLSTTPFYTGTIIGVSSISQGGIAHTGYNGTFVVTGFAGTTTVSYATTGYVGPVAASIGAVTTGYAQLLTDDNVTNTTWSTAQTHGWFGGGFSPGPSILSTVDRIDFSNDTGIANIRGPLSSTKRQLVATGNSNYGWFGGGAPGPVSTVDRINFSNDLATASPRGPLSSVRYYLAATGNSNYGWFGGGATVGTPSIVSTVDRINFSNDSSTALPRGPLSLARYTLVATGNSNYGWFGGGLGLISTVDRIDFSNDFATASVRGPLSLARDSLAATGNSNYGWFGGGRGALSSVDRVDFSNDSTTALLRGQLTSARYFFAAIGNSNYGWFGGGFNGVIPVETVDRIDFSNDSATASPRGPLSSVRSDVGATSGQARSSSTRLQKAGNYGWFGGGFNAAQLNIVDRVDFSNDSSTALVRGPLSLERNRLASTGNSNYGWFGGGDVPGASSRIDRIDFSNDSATASPRSSLSSTKQQLAATGNSNYGWFGGGLNPPLGAAAILSTVDRINFSNDSTTASPRGSLNESKYNLTATGNSNYGWFGGGSTVFPNLVTTGTVNRINFSNDLATASSRSPLFTARQNTAATGNSNYGWFGGGNSGTPLVSTVDRIDFSNDSATALSRGLLSSAKYILTATGNSNYGWFGGGAIPGPAILSTVDRIDFSNDSATASPRSPLSSARFGLAATSNTTR